MQPLKPYSYPENLLRDAFPNMEPQWIFLNGRYPKDLLDRCNYWIDSTIINPKYRDIVMNRYQNHMTIIELSKLSRTQSLRVSQILDKCLCDLGSLSGLHSLQEVYLEEVRRVA